MREFVLIIPVEHSCSKLSFPIPFFCIDDDYLSVSEMNYSNISSKDQNEIMADLARKKAII